jgi:hypothetical protein
VPWGGQFKGLFCHGGTCTPLIPAFLRWRDAQSQNYKNQRSSRKIGTDGDVNLVTKITTLECRTAAIQGSPYAAHTAVVPVADAVLPLNVLMSMAGNGDTGQLQVLHEIGTLDTEVRGLWATLGAKHDQLVLLSALLGHLNAAAEGAARS